MSDRDRMDLAGFLEIAPMTLAAFAEAMRRIGQVDGRLDPTQRHTEQWWWHDVAAYLRYVDLDETLRALTKDVTKNDTDTDGSNSL